MEQKALMNQLKLSHFPISNKEFTILRKRKLIQEKLKLSNIYIIAQRPLLRFDNLKFSNEILEFDIKQANNSKKLSCIVPIPQKYYNSPLSNIGVGSFDNETIIDSQPYHNIHEIIFYFKTSKNQTISNRMTPEKFLYNCWTNRDFRGVEGDIQEFTKYKVHYVGKATEQEICKRLTGHTKLQDILSLERPLSFGELPTHEIAILLFHIQEHIEIKAIYSKSSSKSSTPDYKTRALDIEKALIKAMSPKYNEVLFKNYPNTKDILNKYKYSSIYYHFADSITLEYPNGKIEGCYNGKTKDYIQIYNNKPIRVGELKK